MNSSQRIVFLLFAALLLGGCAVLLSSKSGAPAPISTNVAVVSLADSARQDSQTDNFVSAAASLERALRIEPHNPALWQQLAQTRLAEGQYQQAEALAQRANTWAGDDKALRAANWRIIGQARQQSGDLAGGRSAYERASELLK
ncbi:MAG: tetratricopeptide repeat protein [Acidiferrobacterales bacterium]